MKVFLLELYFLLFEHYILSKVLQFFPFLFIVHSWYFTFLPSILPHYPLLLVHYSSIPQLPTAIFRFLFKTFPFPHPTLLFVSCCANLNSPFQSLPSFLIDPLSIFGKKAALLSVTLFLFISPISPVFNFLISFH